MRLLSNAPGFRMTAVDLAAEAKEGRESVLTALRELRSVGYIIVKKTQDESGRWKTETYVFDFPQCTEVGFPDSGKPDAGCPDPVQYNQQQNQQHKKQQQQQRLRPDAAAFIPKKKRRGDEVVKNGVEVWTSADAAGVSKLVDLHGAQRVEEVAAGLKPAPGHQAPFLSAVFAAFQALAAAEAHRVAQETRQGEAKPPANPEAAAAGLARVKVVLRGGGAVA